MPSAITTRLHFNKITWKYCAIWLSITRYIVSPLIIIMISSKWGNIFHNNDGNEKDLWARRIVASSKSSK